MTCYGKMYIIISAFIIWLEVNLVTVRPLESDRRRILFMKVLLDLIGDELIDSILCPRLSIDRCSPKNVVCKKGGIGSIGSIPPSIRSTHVSSSQRKLLVPA